MQLKFDFLVDRIGYWLEIDHQYEMNKVQLKKQENNGLDHIKIEANGEGRFF